MLLTALASVVLAGSAQSASDSPERQAAPLTCAHTLTAMLAQNPGWARAPALPEDGSYRISFETTMTLKFDNASRPGEHRLVCTADMTADRIVSAKVDGVEALTTPIAFMRLNSLSTPSR